MDDRVAPNSYAFKIAFYQCSNRIYPLCSTLRSIYLSPILTSLLILLVYEHLLVPLEYEIPCTKELFTK